MNSKLIEFRDYYTQLQDSAMQQSAFKEGFNMALELNLTTKFLEWFLSEKSDNIKEIFSDSLIDTNEKEINVDKKAKESLEKLYNFWLNNIFVPVYK